MSCRPRRRSGAELVGSWVFDCSCEGFWDEQGGRAAGGCLDPSRCLLLPRRVLAVLELFLCVLLCPAASPS